MRQTVRLLGDLGERYGSEHVYYGLRCPADAIKLLCINHPEFQNELSTAHHRGIGYTLVQAEHHLDQEDLHLPLGKNDLILAPVIAGSGGGFGKIFVGVALIAAAIVLGPAAGGFLGLGAGLAGGGAGVIGGLAATAIGSLGAALVLNGAVDLLSPQPTIPTIDTGRRGEPGQNTNASGPQGVSRATSGVQSYAYSGPANTVGVGATIPLVYGEMLIGSHLLSAQVIVSDESDPSSDYFTRPGPSSITINGDIVQGKFASNGGLRTRKWEKRQLKYKNEGSGDEANRRIADEVMQLDFSNIQQTIGPFGDKDDSNARKNFHTFFELDRGFFQKANNQIVPAYLTYEMAIVKDKLNQSEEEPVTARVQGTIQGLLRDTDDFKWCHAITYGNVGNEDEGTIVEVKVSIIDTNAEPNQRLVVRAAGYEFFRDDDENRTEKLDTQDY